MLYQICYVSEGKGKQRQVTNTAMLNADNIVDAYTATEEAITNNADYIIYPFATLTDNGESIYTLADYVCKQHFKWELRNNAAALAALKKSLHDKEDERQTAAAAIVAALADNANNMYIVFNAAYNAVAAIRDNLYRISEVEYNPSAAFCNPFTVRKVKATYPQLCRLIKKATEEANLTEAQMQVLNMYESNTTCAAACVLLNITKRAYYKHLYKAFYKVLAAAVELDKSGIFAAAGITEEDTAAALATYEKRAKTK